MVMESSRKILSSVEIIVAICAGTFQNIREWEFRDTDGMFSIYRESSHQESAPYK